MAPAVFPLRPAIEEDRSRLANLLHFETHVHRHLDWRLPLDWLGHSPFLVSEQSARILAALACPPDPPGVAWIRLFAVTTRVDIGAAWQGLWAEAHQTLAEMQVLEAAAIPLNEWFARELRATQFAHTHNVVVLNWNARQTVADRPGQGLVRPMAVGDLPAVYEVDKAAFVPLWQNPLQALEHAFEQAGYATVIEDEGRVVAYQISTLSAHGLHLARLATHPSAQGRGLALTLTTDLQRQVQKGNELRLSVNTQDNNQPSLALYKKLGFTLTGETFPVYEFKF
ncbi:MAG TPA: GNAT family N-acetyltransferase [Anaerolineales bacterium]|nr:GNAT family N-acetyltransferase [Anaerolineales bacterium]HRQ91808.1 GNAT family N-acetyltransferase [Anaerolineales bacterium]